MNAEEQKTELVSELLPGIFPEQPGGEGEVDQIQAEPIAGSGWLTTILSASATRNRGIKELDSPLSE